MPDQATVDGTRLAARAAVLDRLWRGLVRDGVLSPDHEYRHRYDDPGDLMRALGHEAFALELDDSVANLALARAARPEPDGGPPMLTRNASLADFEQLVVDGHPLHPGCRTRLGMSTAEVKAYAPEHRPVIRVPIYSVPPSRWLATGTGTAARLPVHPWQAEHVLGAYPFLTPTGHELAARPLLSLRTVAPMRLPRVHLKLALDVQMTSAVRIVSPAAVRNGPVVSALLKRLTRDLPGIEVLGEPAGGAVLVNGEPCRSLAYLEREAPVLAEGEVALPIAALAAPSPADGRPLIAEALRQHKTFFEDVCRLMVPPLLELLHRGVALEAHGQNTLLVLRDGRPVRLLYRDLGGVRISRARLERYGTEVPPIHGDLLTDDPEVLRTKLFAALYSTVLSELVELLGGDPAPLWRIVARVTRQAVHPADADVLTRPTLPLKAMTAMRLAADPLRDQWTQIPNPMVA